MLEQEPGSRALHTFITDGNSNLVIRPDMGRRVLAVAYPPEMPEVDDPLADAPPVDHEDHAARIRRAVAERLPSMAIAKTVSTTSGAYDITPDYHPILGWANEIADVTGPVPGRRVLRPRAQAVALGRRDRRGSRARH